jgi:2-methylcitrate dehydratase PrpD
MTSLLQFAERVTTARALGGSAKWEARLAFIDTVGCMLADSGEKATRISEQAARLWGEGCSCSVQSDTRRLGPSGAAFVDAAALRLLDWPKHAERSPAAQILSLVHDEHAAHLRSRTA